MLVDAAREPRLRRPADEPADAVLPGLVGRPWRRLPTAATASTAPAELDAAGPDERWHAVRINGKRARYAVDAVAAVLGGEAAELAKALAGVQDLLGEHQDAAVAADTWLAIADRRSRRPRAGGDRRPAVRAGAGRRPRGAGGVPGRVARPPRSAD